MTTNNEFTCARCARTFKKAWSDEECTAERERDWADYDEEDCVLVCNDCYIILLGKLDKRVN